jgi:hypothetical protein
MMNTIDKIQIHTKKKVCLKQSRQIWNFLHTRMVTFQLQNDRNNSNFPASKLCDPLFYTENKTKINSVKTFSYDNMEEKIRPQFLLIALF